MADKGTKKASEDDKTTGEGTSLQDDQGQEGTSLQDDQGQEGTSFQDDQGQEESLMQRLLARFGVMVTEDNEEKPEQLLEEVTFEGIAKFMETEQCKNVIVMTGAGVSTAAGIPDFRSPGTGLYDNLQKYNLPSPECVFEIRYFKANPEPFYKLAKEIYPGSFKPTVAHYFVKLLEDKDLLLRIYTQNIDTLERIAGISGDRIVEAHGTFYTAHCLDCNMEYSEQFVKDKVFQDKIPKCTKCEGLVKPDIVFFGESLPQRFVQLVDKDMSKCDLLIVMGTSLVVQPFASLISSVPETTPRLLINREKSGNKGDMMSFLFGGDGFCFDKENNYRDVAWLGNADDGCLALADLLGWKDELEAMVKNSHKSIDDAMKAANPACADSKPGEITKDKTQRAVDDISDALSKTSLQDNSQSDSSCSKK